MDRQQFVVNLNVVHAIVTPMELAVDVKAKFAIHVFIQDIRNNVAVHTIDDNLLFFTRFFVYSTPYMKIV